jgi:AcrR family transcriptional regulator
MGRLPDRAAANVPYRTNAAIRPGILVPHMTETIDRRAARTRKALYEALISLILRKGYEAITIQDLIDEADVGRSTFYAHYTGKEDLLRSGFETLRKLLTEAQRSALAKTSREESERLGFSLAMFEHACQYRTVYRALIGSRGGAVVGNEIRRALSEVVKKDLAAVPDDGAIARELRVQFVVGTFLNVLTWCLEQKSDITPAQIDVMFRQLVLNGLGLPRANGRASARAAR